MANARTLSVLRCALLVGISWLVPNVALSDDGLAIQFDPSLVEPWKESEPVIPVYPSDADLVPFRLMETDTIKAFVDPKSVSRASDGVLRFAIVVQSTSGVRNVFFDGIRCETREFKTYAVGVKNAFVAMKNSKWQEIQRLPHNAFRHVLYKYYACNSASSSAFEPEDFLRRLNNRAINLE